MHEVAAELDAIVAEGQIPSASVAVRVGGDAVLLHALGFERLDPPRLAHVGSVYDLASVTKPFAGGALAADLVQRGLLDLDAPVADVLADVDPRVTARQLLSHSSGYPAWAPLYEGVPKSSWGRPEARRAILEAARRSPLVGEPGQSHVYSDLGFLVLCDLLEILGGAPLDQQVQQRILGPAGVDLRWGWPGAAATEDCPVRGHVVEGEVHDLNAFAMGGVSTHAGLFGTAGEAARLADALLDAAQGRRHDLPDLSAFWSARGPGSHRLGWDSVTVGSYTSTGGAWPADGVGHLGYTGTSIWLAPRERVVVAFFTNRVHPVDAKEAIRAARPRLHDAVARALRWRGALA